MGQYNAKQKLSAIISVLIAMIVMFFACFFSYKVGVDTGKNNINLQDWQIDVSMEQEIALVSTDYGLIWIYQFDEGYFGQ